VFVIYAQCKREVVDIYLWFDSP